MSTADASTRSLADSVGPGWADALAPVSDVIAQLGDFLRAERAANRPFLPNAARILAALQQPLDDVRVLIVGQDPYPTPGHPVGLSFSVGADVRPLAGRASATSSRSTARISATRSRQTATSRPGASAGSCSSTAS